MSITITKERENMVYERLLDALEVVNKDHCKKYYGPLSSDQEKLLRNILLGNHLTYRYILLTALAAKTAIPEVNILSLQTKDDNANAYDARSVAHNVIVPFERKHLHQAIGGSNEPFLNKPARFTSISKLNAVRKGKDREKLYELVDVLPTFTSENMFAALCAALDILLEKSNISAPVILPTTSTPTAFKISLRKILFDISLKGLEGQTLPLTCAIVMTHLLDAMGIAGTVQLHPVNEAGSSSKEVEDIDVYVKEKLIYTIEAKDKLFEVHDVEHALSKVKRAGLDSMFFIYGAKIFPSELVITESEKVADAMNIYLIMLPFNSFLDLVLGIYGVLNKYDVQSQLHEFASVAKMTESVHKAIDSVIAEAWNQ